MKKLAIKKTSIIDISRATILALIMSLMAVLVLGLIVKLTSIGDNVIQPINQVIKILSILAGCLMGIKCTENGAIKGGLIGLLYSVMSVFIFSLLSKSFSMSNFNYIDIIAGIFAGVVSGIIAVNFKKK